MNTFKQILEKIDATLLIVGRGDQSQARKLAISLEIYENVVFTGFVDDLILKKCYVLCDVYVCFSRLEGFGLTILEAMAARKPIIAFNVGAIPEIVRDGLNGRVLDRQNPKELADAMIFFADNFVLAKRIGSRNRKYVAEKFSWKKTARMTEHVYQELLSDSK